MRMFLRISNLIELFLFISFISQSFSFRRHHRRSLANDERFLKFNLLSSYPSKITSNEKLLLECQYTLDKSDVKHVRLEWRKDGSVISPNQRHFQLLSNGSLFVEHLGSADEGSYQCSVHIGLADGSQWTYLGDKIRVVLPELPRFQSNPTNQTIVRGEPVVFHCFTSTSPAPSVTWYHNGVIIKQGGEYHILPVTNSLEISSVQPRHEGEYKCIVEGSGKRRTSESGFLALARGKQSEADITFLSQPQDQSVVVGEHVVLECLASSSSSPDVRWLKDSRQLPIDGKRIRKVGMSSLLIEKVITDDSGFYTCRASNSVDNQDLTVELKIISPPHITTHPNTKVALENADIEFECLSSGRPKPSISWFKNGEAIIPSGYFVIEPNKLRILGVMAGDQGVYQCSAENSAGFQQTSAQLLVDSPDATAVAASSGQPLIASAPLGLKETLIGSRVIAVEWDPPVLRNGQIMRYHVSFKEENSERERVMNFSSTSATLKGLQPDTLYLVRVAAENEAGVGKTSDYIKVTTREEQAVPGRVTNLKAKAIGSEAIEVSWDPPQVGPVALRYKVFYIKSPPDDEEETQTVTSATTYTFHGMDKFTEYLIRVEADGDKGSGLSSDTVSVRTLSDIPREPPKQIAVEAISSTSVRVTWKEPVEGVNGNITGYKIKYKTKSRGTKGNVNVVDADKREYTINSLEPDTPYMVRMAVVNHNGSGEFSDWLHVTTLLRDKEEVVLGAPREIGPIAGLDHIIVSWLPPSDESSLVREYQVGWGHGVPDSSTVMVPSNVMQYKIKNLKPGREYVISVRASNNQGVGFPIYETIKTLQKESVSVVDSENADPAMTPLGVRAEAVSATSMRVVWTEADPNAFNTYYTVRYSTSADGNVMKTQNSSEPYIIIDGLKPATEYEFAVRALASSGSVSQWSMSAIDRTFTAPPSSAPRDLTVLPAANGDIQSVSLTWQPPKYANGEIEEYLIFYTDKVSAPDKNWTTTYVRGDRLSYHPSNLLPRTVYYFKIQARNEKGYGPFSPIESYSPLDKEKSIISSPTESDSHWNYSKILSDRSFLLLLGVIFVIIISIALILCCYKGCSSNKNGYGGKRSNASGNGDLWINHPGGSHIRGAPSDYMVDGMSSGLVERLTGPDVVESPPPRYQPLQDSAYGSVSVRNSRTPVRQSVSSYEEERRPVIGRAKPMLASVHSYGTEDSQTTLSRSYHQSSNSLEGRQRTPQVVYTGSGRHPNVSKLDYNDSPYGSSSALNSGTPPLPLGGPPSGPPIVDGYRTLRGTPPGGNPLRSFTQLANTPSSGRPVVVAAGGRQLPVGRATAQPRVNVSNIYSPYATCSSDTEMEKKPLSNEIELHPTTSLSDIQPSNSTEDLTAEMVKLDTFIDDLQKYQHDIKSEDTQLSA
ncbi:unnamed protein product [Auanema sp. JU1783]|nr:unnamed protein product [Auanema sp. JU1783]